MSSKWYIMTTIELQSINSEFILWFKSGIVKGTERNKGLEREMRRCRETI